MVYQLLSQFNLNTAYENKHRQLEGGLMVMVQWWHILISAHSYTTNHLKFIYTLSLPCGLLFDIYCCFLVCIVNLGVIPGFRTVNSSADWHPKELKDITKIRRPPT